MIKISFQQICAYLEGKCSAKDLGYIENLRQEDCAAELLMDVVDELIRHTHGIKPSPVGQSYADIKIDVALESLLSGTIQPQDAELIIRQLAQSSSFYELFMLKIARIARTDKGKVHQTLRHVQIREDGELLAVIKSASAKPKRKKVALLTKYFSPAIKEFWAKMRGRRVGFPVAPRWVTRIAIIIVAIAVVCFWRLSNRQEHRFTYYLFADRVPYEYDGYGWRGAIDFAEDARMNSIQSQFKLAISDYMLRDYHKAISQFEMLQSAITNVRSQTRDRSTLAFVRDYYFYFGLSHFANANNPRFDNSEKKSQLDQAIQRISQADQIGKLINAVGTDREIYFLGLVFTFASRSDSALTHLRTIKPESIFYQDSIALIKQLTGN